MSWGAVGQWMCVLSLLFFFASYHFEFNQVFITDSSQTQVAFLRPKGTQPSPLQIQVPQILRPIVRGVYQDSIYGGSGSLKGLGGSKGLRDLMGLRA